MERHEVIDQLRALKLYGMVGVYDEAVTQGIRRHNSMQEILMTLCLAETAERKARSIKYQLGIAKFPVHKNLDTFQKFFDSNLSPDQILLVLYIQELNYTRFQTYWVLFLMLSCKLQQL